MSIRRKVVVLTMVMGTLLVISSLLVHVINESPSRLKPKLITRLSLVFGDIVDYNDHFGEYPQNLTFLYEKLNRDPRVIQPIDGERYEYRRPDALPSTNWMIRIVHDSVYLALDSRGTRVDEDSSK